MMYFQRAAAHWLKNCMGEEIFHDKVERCQRFMEESLELVQACGMTREEAIQMVDYVFNRPTGEMTQEVGGASITLNVLCEAFGVDRYYEERVELDRCYKNMDLIRAKQLRKPKIRRI